VGETAYLFSQLIYRGVGRLQRSEDPRRNTSGERRGRGRVMRTHVHMMMTEAGNVENGWGWKGEDEEKVWVGGDGPRCVLCE
jgi:hypothetical protein